ncbi:hypothetical protein [Gulosibacter sp. 10]|uniref:hypothetical protein n=1 Tax=Gulosibacter sp. 10 TaxID=1255570 RepID=UPI00097EF9E7|nr:hypothetical protein [Gulosibacter sp. 10]SJM67674.1 hypothetical protein FM112_12780 [Gulosibacter sp. 10]
MDWLNSWLTIAAVLFVVFMLLRLLLWRPGNGGRASVFGVDGASSDDPIVIGTVREVEATGTTINDVRVYKVRFDVETGDGATHEASLKRPIGPEDIGSLTPGSVLPVSFSAKHGKAGLVEESRIAEAQAAIVEWRMRHGFLSARDLEIIESGVEADGWLVDVVPAGLWLEDEQAYALRVQVRRADGSTFRATRLSYSPEEQAGKFQIDSHVRVHYLPEDESHIVIATPAKAGA